MALKKVAAVAGPLSVASIRRAVDAREDVHSPSTDQRGAVLTTAVIETDDISVILREISVLWVQAQRSFLSIGRYLTGARSRLQRNAMLARPGASEADLRSAVKAEFAMQVIAHLPFSDKVAFQLEAVAREVFERERLTVDELPPNYSVAYQLTTLTEHELAQAKQAGLVSQTVRREDIINFKRRIRSGATSRRQLLEERRGKLRALIRRLEGELADIEQELNKAASDADGNSVL